MIAIRAAIGTEKYGMIFSTRKDGLIIMKHKREDTGKIVVPESLRAYVLKMFHNSQMAARIAP